LTIGVIADTHIYAHGRREVPAPVLDLFKRAGTGLIVHLGDVNSAYVLEELATIAPLLAVVGNNDDDELQDALPARIRFTVGKHRFGAIHGDGGRSAREVVTATFAGKADIALFGHSHIPMLDKVKGTTILNPGSATDRRWHQHFGVAIVHVTEALIDPELILYADPAHLVNITFDDDPADAPEEERASS
jgi:putative phosphoesterase